MKIGKSSVSGSINFTNEDHIMKENMYSLFVNEIYNHDLIKWQIKCI